MERVNKEIKRRSRVVGIFPNNAVEMQESLKIPTNCQTSCPRSEIRLVAIGCN